MQFGTISHLLGWVCTLRSDIAEVNLLLCEKRDVRGGIIVIFLFYCSTYYMRGTEQNLKGVQRVPALLKFGRHKLRLVFSRSSTDETVFRVGCHPESHVITNSSLMVAAK